jgi:hypothetical protein
MNEDKFREYLKGVVDSSRVISDCISRCRRVAKYEGDLDVHFNTDKGKLLLDKLAYSRSQAEQSINPKHNIQIKGDKGYFSIYEGTSSLLNAVKRYFDFLGI